MKAKFKRYLEDNIDLVQVVEDMDAMCIHSEYERLKRTFMQTYGEQTFRMSQEDKMNLETEMFHVYIAHLEKLGL